MAEPEPKIYWFTVKRTLRPGDTIKFDLSREQFRIRRRPWYRRLRWPR